MKIILEFDDGHKVELEYDGSCLFYQDNSYYKKNISPEYIRAHPVVVDPTHLKSPTKELLMFIKVDPQKLVEGVAPFQDKPLPGDAK